MSAGVNGKRGRVVTAAGLLVILFVVVAISVYAQSKQPAASPGDIVSWVEGTVSFGPPCPSPTYAASCVSRPLAGVVVDLRFADGGVARTTTDQDGSYECVQPGGGTVTVIAEPVKGAQTPPPVTVTLTAGRGAHIDLRYTASNS